MLKWSQFSDKICILGHCRSGTTSLFHALMPPFSLLRSINEPFRGNNDPCATWKQTAFKRKQHLANFDLLKHHVHHSYLDEIIDMGFNIVKLYRRNIIQTALSDVLATRMGHWNPNDDYVKKVQGFEVSLSSMEVYIKRYQKDVKDLKKLDAIETLVYEDFYLNSLDFRKKKVKKIFAIMGHDSSLLPDSHLNYWMGLARKQNTIDIYRSIRNIDEIEKEFGCSKNGSLFGVN